MDTYEAAVKIQEMILKGREFINLSGYSIPNRDIKGFYEYKESIQFIPLPTSDLSTEELRNSWIRAMRATLEVNPKILLIKYYEKIVETYSITPKEVGLSQGW